jgi:orotidine-5'-phosphate decarboxylase
MTAKEISEQIREKKTCLCVGLDTDLAKLPQHLKRKPNAILEFNKEIIASTRDLCVAYKINTAFYECLGARGWEIMEETLSYIPHNVFKIADAKRGDIGNTSSMYAKAFFGQMNFDAITVSPYMGSDSVKPFLEHTDKFTIILALTSNPGSADFEQQKTGDQFLYEKVLATSQQWGTPENIMYVIGATKAEALAEIRKIVPSHFLLIPGVGAQGGKIEDVLKYGAIPNDIGLLVNSSRQILYASGEENFAEAARKEAMTFQGKI